jgi:phage gpG-like protein
MSMIAARIEGQPELQDRVNKILNKALDPVALLDESSAILLNSIRSRFLNALDTDGTPWVVSHAAIWRDKSGRGGKTLFDTGNLFHSIQLFAVGNDSRAIGTDVPYGRKHQFGEEGMIRREFLGVSEEDKELVMKMILRRMTEAVEE